MMNLMMRGCQNSTAPQCLREHWVSIPELRHNSVFVRSPSPVGSSITSFDHVSSSVFYCLWSDDMKLSAKRLCDTSHSICVFGCFLKTFLLLENGCIQRIRGYGDDMLYKFTFTLQCHSVEYIIQSKWNSIV